MIILHACFKQPFKIWVDEKAIEVESKDKTSSGIVKMFDDYVQKLVATNCKLLFVTFAFIIVQWYKFTPLHHKYNNIHIYICWELVLGLVLAVLFVLVLGTWSIS